MWERISLTKIAYILLAVILLIIVLGVRFPAKSQDLSLEEWVVVLSERLTSITGSPVESKFLGNTADDPQLRELLAADEDSFVFFRNDSRLELRMGDLLRTEASSAPETTKFALSSVLLRNDIDYGVVALSFGDSVSYVFVPVNGSEPVGVLMELSRELLGQAEMITSEGGCSEWLPVSLNILRKPAEQIQVCARSYCEYGMPKKCAVTGVNKTVGLFASLDTFPEPPADMTSVGSVCVGDTNFSLNYLNFSINALVFQVDPSFEIGGSLESSLDCSGKVSLVRR